VIGALLVPMAAPAKLVEVDLDTAGDGLITRDTETALDWLDVNVTVGQSFDAVTAALGPGGVLEGFRYASRSEVVELWQNAGIVDIDLPGFVNYTAANFDGASRILDLVGTTPFFNQTGVQGICDTPAPSGATYRLTPQVALSPSEDTAEARTNGVIAVDYDLATIGSWLVRPAPPIEAIRIDVKPGSHTNFINPFGHGVIRVALFGSASFDVADIDPPTLALGPAGSPLEQRPGPHFEDIDADGVTDLLGHYRTAKTGIALGDTKVCVTGETFDGRMFEGCDAIRTVPGCGKGFVLSLVLPPFIWLRERRRPAAA
jgi:hypothetical protein